MIGILYLTIVSILAASAIWIPDRDYRLGTAIMFVGSFASTAAFALTPGSWGDGMPFITVIDVVATCIFVVLALRSQHFWPLWLAGFQIGALASHITIMIDTNALPYAMGVLQGFWAWFQITVLAGIALLHLYPRGMRMH